MQRKMQRNREEDVDEPAEVNKEDEVKEVKEEEAKVYVEEDVKEKHMKKQRRTKRRLT